MSCHRSVAESHRSGHGRLLALDVDVSPDETLPALEPLRVTVVTFVTTPSTTAVVAELRRGAMQVELRTADVFEGSPQAPVYVIAVDATTSETWAERIVSWASAGALRRGLIVLIAHGSPRDWRAPL